MTNWKGSALALGLAGRVKRSLVLAAIATLALPSWTHAQSTARLRGTVTDEQGAAVPGANIVVRNQATGEERSSVSDKSGEYQIASLQVGISIWRPKSAAFRPE